MPSMNTLLKLTIENASNDCCSFCIASALSILFISHFGLNMFITYQLYIDGFIVIFGFSISLILAVYTGSWLFGSVFFISSGDEDIPNPTTPLGLIIFFITAGEFDIITNPISRCCSSINRRFSCCKLLNHIIVVLLLPIFIIFGPLYSVSFLMVKKEDEGFTVAVYYQLSFIIPTTIIQIIILCLAIKSLPIIITTLCMIAVCIGLTYFIIIIFFSFDLLRTDNLQYIYILPFMITIELLLILTMIFIVSFMNLWHANFTDIQYILLLICFINIFIPNIPFLKTYLMEAYCDILRRNVSLQYVIQSNDSTAKIDKMFCVLLHISGRNSVAIRKPVNNVAETEVLLNKSTIMTTQQSIMEQYKFSLMSKTEKSQLIDQNIKAIDLQIAQKSNIMTNVLGLIYILFSFIAVITPIVWMIWITISDTLSDLKQFIFLWCFTSYYIMILMGLIVYMIINKIKLSYDSIKYTVMYNKIGRKVKKFNGYLDADELNTSIKPYYSRFPVIKIVFDRFQYDIGMIIILYLFESKVYRCK
eukprot:327825_1